MKGVRRMEMIKEADFRKQIKAAPRAAYLFFGDEDYMKSFALKTAIEAISPDSSLSFFNEIRIDALSYSPAALIEAMMPAPMMADRKLIILSGLDMNAMKQSEIDSLCEALAYLDEYDYNTLIISVAADRFDAGILPKKPSKLLTKLSEFLTPVNFEKNSPAKLAAWVAKHFEHNGVIAPPDICSLIIERCGRDMYNLSSETDKVSYYVLSQGRDTVTRDDVINIAIMETEYDVFAFANAISARRREEALDILRDMKKRRVEPVALVSEITRIACDMYYVATLCADGMTSKEISEVMKIHEYRVQMMMKSNPGVEMCKNMIEKCRRADADSKSYGDAMAVLERLICTI